MKCGKCGFENPSGAPQCTLCGNSLRYGAAAQNPFVLSFIVWCIIMAAAIFIYYPNKLSDKIKNVFKKDQTYTFSEETYLERGREYYKKKDWNNAEVEYKKALGVNPKNSDTHNVLGVIYYNKNMFDMAMAEYRLAIEINPKNPRPYYNISLIYCRQGKFDEAIKAAKKAIELKPDYAFAYYNLSRAYYSKKDYNNALINCNKAIEFGYNVPQAFKRKIEELKKNRQN